jgi:hypothetical protein
MEQILYTKDIVLELNKNSDNHSLAPMGGNGFMTGWVDEVNGWGAREIDEFVVTRHELLHLVEFWTKVRLNSHLTMYEIGRGNSRCLRLVQYAMNRIDRIARSLGQETVDYLVKMTEEEFAKPIDPELWRAFREDEIESLNIWIPNLRETELMDRKVQAKLHEGFIIKEGGFDFEKEFGVTEEGQWK